ncbi:hypothetical protein MMC10_002186 [Thelotrema lepadinum]|nr:hypothetical protein [Thelotrema lepadinum]
MSQAAGPFFGRLPAELRVFILSFLTFDWFFLVRSPLQHSRALFEVDIRRLRLDGSRARRNYHLWALKSLISIAKTCRLLASESLTQIYHTQTFVFDSLGPMFSFCSVLRPSLRKCIRSIVIKPPRYAQNEWKRAIAKLLVRLDGVQELVWTVGHGRQPRGQVFKKIVRRMAAKNLVTVNGRPVAEVLDDDFQLPASPVLTPAPATEPVVIDLTSLPSIDGLAEPDVSTGNILPPDSLPQLDTSVLIDDAGPSGSSLIPSNSFATGTPLQTSTAFPPSTGYSAGASSSAGTVSSFGLDLSISNNPSFDTDVPWGTSNFPPEASVNPFSTPFVGCRNSIFHPGTPASECSIPDLLSSPPDIDLVIPTIDSSALVNLSRTRIYPSAAPDVSATTSAISPSTTCSSSANDSCDMTDPSSSTWPLSNTYQAAPDYQTPVPQSVDWSDPSINSILCSAFQPAFSNIQSVNSTPGTMTSQPTLSHSPATRANQGTIVGASQLSLTNQDLGSHFPAGNVCLGLPNCRCTNCYLNNLFSELSPRAGTFLSQDETA